MYKLHSSCFPMIYHWQSLSLKKMHWPLLVNCVFMISIQKNISLNVYVSWSNYMDSNSSTLFFVFPARICFNVLYLSRPCLTFSACNISLRVCLPSSFFSWSSASSSWKNNEILWLPHWESTNDKINWQDKTVSKLTPGTTWGN